MIGELIEAISGGSLLLMLIFVAVFSLVLGMGLPTTATYIVITSLMAPVIIAVGAKSGLIVPLIAVHMFVFYFGILADDTPPVGLAAFAAAAISKGDPIKTGIIGFSYDVRTAILPFLFIFNTELLLIDVTVGKSCLCFYCRDACNDAVRGGNAELVYYPFKVMGNSWIVGDRVHFFPTRVWLDMIDDPWVELPPTELMTLADTAPDDASFRVRLMGENFATGKVNTTTVELPLGMASDGDGATRLKRHAGIAFRIEDDGKVYVDNLQFGGRIQEQGVDFDWELLVVEQSADRMPKEVFYLPAIALLALISWLQLGRARKFKVQEKSD